MRHHHFNFFQIPKSCKFIFKNKICRTKINLKSNDDNYKINNTYMKISWSKYKIHLTIQTTTPSILQVFILHQKLIYVKYHLFQLFLLYSDVTFKHNKRSWPFVSAGNPFNLYHNAKSLSALYSCSKENSKIVSILTTR